jgi:toxin ParE1/3/4
MLADTPLAGKACDNIKAGYKKFPQGSHIIFYKVGSQTSIEIIRILHKHMDVDAQLSP